MSELEPAQAAGNYQLPQWCGRRQMDFHGRANNKQVAPIGFTWRPLAGRLELGHSLAPAAGRQQTKAALTALAA